MSPHPNTPMTPLHPLRRRLLRGALYVFVLGLLVAWSSHWMTISGKRHQFERLYALVGSPMAVSAADRRAMNWEMPMMLALAPWGLLVVAGVRRKMMRRRESS